MMGLKFRPEPSRRIDWVGAVREFFQTGWIGLGYLVGQYMIRYSNMIFGRFYKKMLCNTN